MREGNLSQTRDTMPPCQVANKGSCKFPDHHEHEHERPLSRDPTAGEGAMRERVHGRGAGEKKWEGKCLLADATRC